MVAMEGEVAVRLETSRLGGTLAAEVRGVDLNKIDDAIFGAIREAWLEHHVLVLRDQKVTPAALAGFAARFGPMNVFPKVKGEDAARSKEHDDVIVIRNVGLARAYTGIWHSDASSWQEPPATTVLCARKLPSVGGDTSFANQHLAYESLSEGMKRMLLGL